MCAYLPSSNDCPKWFDHWLWSQRQRWPNVGATTGSLMIQSDSSTELPSQHARPETHCSRRCFCSTPRSQRRSSHNSSHITGLPVVMTRTSGWQPVRLWYYTRETTSRRLEFCGKSRCWYTLQVSGGAVHNGGDLFCALLLTHRSLLRGSSSWHFLLPGYNPEAIIG